MTHLSDDERMKELSEGVQKIFKDAVNQKTPRPSLPVEQPKNQVLGFLSKVYVMLCYVTRTGTLRKKERKKGSWF